MRRFKQNERIVKSICSILFNSNANNHVSWYSITFRLNGSHASKDLFKIKKRVIEEILTHSYFITYVNAILSLKGVTTKNKVCTGTKKYPVGFYPTKLHEWSRIGSRIIDRTNNGYVFDYTITVRSCPISDKDKFRPRKYRNMMNNNSMNLREIL